MTNSEEELLVDINKNCMFPIATKNMFKMRSQEFPSFLFELLWILPFIHVVGMSKTHGQTLWSVTTVIQLAFINIWCLVIEYPSNVLRFIWLLSISGICRWIFPAMYCYPVAPNLCPVSLDEFDTAGLWSRQHLYQNLASLECWTMMQWTSVNVRPLLWCP